MLKTILLETEAFSTSSITEVNFVACPELEGLDESVALIESFSQPFPMRERSVPVIDGEMVRHGQDTAAIRFYG